MPVIKSAIKKLRRDKKAEQANDDFRKMLDRALRDAKKTKSAKAVNSAVSIVDKAVKKHLMHKNRAARLKSSLSKLAKPVKSAAKGTEPVKKAVAKKVKTAAKSVTKK